MLHDVIAYAIKHDAVLAQVVSIAGVLIAQAVTVYKILSDRQIREEQKQLDKIKEAVIDGSLRYGVDKSAINQAILDAANVAIIVTDDRCYILEWNDAATAMFGWRASEVVGKHVSIIIPEMMHAAHMAGVDRYVKHGHGTMMNTTVGLQAVTKKGECINICFSLSEGEFTDGHKFFCGVISALVTLTDLSGGNVIKLEQRNNIATIYGGYIERNITAQALASANEESNTVDV